jgi:phage tail sheath protein FI
VGPDPAQLRQLPHQRAAKWVAHKGTITEEAICVTSDRTTMTLDDIDNGRLTWYVGIEPAKPVEFVILRVS